MTVSGLNAASASVGASHALPQSARAADGDYKTRSASTSQVKDADGDYKVASRSPAAQSSSAVQNALTSLVKGG